MTFFFLKIWIFEEFISDIITVEQIFSIVSLYITPGYKRNQVCAELVKDFWVVNQSNSCGLNSLIWRVISAISWYYSKVHDFERMNSLCTFEPQCYYSIYTNYLTLNVFINISLKFRRTVQKIFFSIKGSFKILLKNPNFFLFLLKKPFLSQMRTKYFEANHSSHLILDDIESLLEHILGPRSLHKIWERNPQNTM